MKCPCCKTELVVGEMMRLETLDEHISCVEPCLKSSYHCPSNCEAEGVVWNDYGDVYGPFKKIQTIPWIDGNNGPFGSLTRQNNIEFGKHDEDKILFTIHCWPFKGWEVWSDWVYKSNLDGDILSRRMKWKWIEPDNTVHMWGHRMLVFCLKNIYSSWRNLRKNPNDKWSRNQLQNFVKQSKWAQAEWWRKCSSVVARLALNNVKKQGADNGLA